MRVRTPRVRFAPATGRYPALRSSCHTGLDVEPVMTTRTLEDSGNSPRCICSGHSWRRPKPIVAVSRAMPRVASGFSTAGSGLVIALAC